MNITIRINCDNAAFENDPSREVARILHNLSVDIDETPIDPGDKITLFDLDDNYVDEYKVTR